MDHTDRKRKCVEREHAGGCEGDVRRIDGRLSWQSRGGLQSHLECCTRYKSGFVALSRPTWVNHLTRDHQGPILEVDISTGSLFSGMYDWEEEGSEEVACSAPSRELRGKPQAMCLDGASGAVSKNSRLLKVLASRAR